DRLLAEGEVIWHGQPLFLVAATSRDAARKAARLGRAEYEALPPLVTVDDARAANSHVEPVQRMAQGDAAAALARAPHRLSGAFAMGG
ncbi:xanthine dehydrogenase molybdopterin binding subunit, partial [Acinetobacter baumannii]